MDEILKKLMFIEEQNRQILDLLTKKKSINKEPLKPINERKQEFKHRCWDAFNQELSIPTIKEFFEYWSESSNDGKKMRFEKETVFDLKRRMDTWLRNSKKVMSNSGANGLNIGN